MTSSDNHVSIKDVGNAGRASASRRPPSLHKSLGDKRFHLDKKRGRRHVCDRCFQVVTYGSQARPFDGTFLVALPSKVPPHIREEMWAQGVHDFTWICTQCLFDDSDCDNMTIDEFREILEIDYVELRQARTKPKGVSL